WRNRTVVRAKGCPAGDVIKELTLNSVDAFLDPARAIAGRESPAMLAVARELHWIAYGVFLLHEVRLARVLEIITTVFAHKRVLDAMEIDPQVRELMGKQGPGVEEFAAIDLLPGIGRTVCRVTLFRQGMARRA